MLSSQCGVSVTSCPTVRFLLLRETIRRNLSGVRHALQPSFHGLDSLVLRPDQFLALIRRGSRPVLKEFLIETAKDFGQSLILK